MGIKWKNIDGFPYAVSSNGIVKNTNTGRVLKPKVHNGYLSVTLCGESGHKTICIHRLVAQAFIPNPSNKPTVNHINEVKSDNHVENLEWSTHREQNVHGTRRERVRASTDYINRGIDYAVVASKHDYDKINEKQRKPVIQYDLSGEIIKRHKGISVAARAVGASPSHIMSCCKKEYGRKTCKGYIWKYEHDEVEPYPIAVTKYRFEEKR